MNTEQAIQRWNRYAERYTANYDEQGDNHRVVLLNPTIFSLLGEVDGNHLLDAGCGEGYLSRLLVKKGARVTAVDFSQKMLDIAMERTPQQEAIQFLHGNCENLSFLADEQFDGIVSNMVLQDLEDYQAALCEMFRLLKPNCAFIFFNFTPMLCDTK